MKRTACLLLALCLLLSACAPANSPESAPEPAEPASAPVEGVAGDPAESELPQRERNWIEDIEFLRDAYKKRHMDPFYLCSEEEFDWKLDRLKAEAGRLSDHDIYFELRSVIAGMGDIHTSVFPPPSLYDRLFPAQFSYFDDKLYLIAYDERCEQLAPWLLHEIVAVNGVDIAYLNQKVDSLGNPFNSWHGRAVFPDIYSFFLPAFFDWAGCDYKEGYTFQFLNENQEVESVELPTISLDEWYQSDWIHPENWELLLYQRGGNWARYLEGENGGYIYISLAELSDPSSIGTLSVQCQRIVEEHPDCGKVVIDLRKNSGGYSYVTELFRDVAHLLNRERPYVLTSGVTTSAATMVASYLKSEFDAVLVGEPSGQFYSFFYLSGDAIEPLTLPHSQLRVLVANKWNQEENLKEYRDEDGKLYKWESTVIPDVFVRQDIEDIRQGRDSVLEWVMKQ